MLIENRLHDINNMHAYGAKYGRGGYQWRLKLTNNRSNRKLRVTPKSTLYVYHLILHGYNYYNIVSENCVKNIESNNKQIHNTFAVKYVCN